jgi:hypothetical protein
MDWRPHPKQEIALLSDCYETLYGGARGGGKTDAGMAKILYWKDHPLFRALVIRKNYTDLKDWRDRAMRMYYSSGVKSSEGDMTFPGGAKVVLGHLKDANAYIKYMGHEYQYILLEELTHIPSEELYLKLISSCRSTIPDLKPQVFATSNPGGAGHKWVKARFIDGKPKMKPFLDPESGRTRMYIPATVDDNPTLMENDPDYVKFLESLPPDLKAQWRFGSWADQKIKGAIFQDDVMQAQGEGRIGMLEVLPHLPVYTSWDLGINDIQTCWFYQLRGEEIRIVDCEKDTGKKYSFYVKMLSDKGYNYGVVILPHDGNKRSPDSLRSFKDALEEAGYEVQIVPRTKDKERDIQTARAVFPRCQFNEQKTMDGLEALSAYRRQWDEENQTFMKAPKHDWSSNFADAFQAMAVSLPKTLRTNELEKYNSSAIHFADHEAGIRKHEIGIPAKQYKEYAKAAKDLILKK